MTEMPGWLSPKYVFNKVAAFKPSVNDTISIVKDKAEKEKLKLFDKYCFRFVRVCEAQRENSPHSYLSVYEVFRNPKPSDNEEERKFGICITLPVYKKITDLDKQNNTISSDIYECQEWPSEYTYPRIYIKRGKKTTIEKYKCILEKRFRHFDRYYIDMNDNIDTDLQNLKTLLIESNEYYEGNWLNVPGKKNVDANLLKYRILFRIHESENSSFTDNQELVNCAYVESISGGNFTKILQNRYDNANPKGQFNYLSEDDEYFGLKIKEYALSRVTIIDERFSERNAGEDAARNVRVLKFVERDNVENFIDFFEGTEFRDKINHTHFLSIHLGLIETILKDKGFTQYMEREYANTNTLPIVALLTEICETFSYPKDILYVCVHSGRGNFSTIMDELNLKMPFIPLSSLQEVYNDSKYSLCQLLYSQKYYIIKYTKPKK